MRPLLLLPVLVIGLAAAPPSLAATGVSITTTGFRPAAVAVVSDETVTWTNNDTARHQVVANDGSFSSPVLVAGQSFSHVFKTAGTFAYHDGIRAGLRGSVGVIPPRTVWVRRAGFQPTPISIQAGEQVTWTNRDTANHQIVADDGSFTSPVLARGRSFSRMFDSAGTFAYHDGLQPTRKGTVVVAKKPAAESVTLTRSARVVTYGGSVLLRGTIANGTSGEKVTITGTTQAGKPARSVLTATTTADGTFSVRVRPLVQTVYVATTGTSSSDPLAINVRPRVRLGVIGRTRGVLRASAARSFVNKRWVVQVLHPRRHVWVSMKRVRLTRSVPTATPTIVTTASFRLHIRHGLRLRVLVPAGQTAPGYVSGVSNIARS